MTGLSIRAASVCATLAVAALLTVACGFAHAAALTRAQGEAILDELQSIRKLLEKQALAPQAPAQPMPQAQQNGTSKVKLDGAYSLGKPDAPLTMVMFTDYQCSFCKSFETQTFADIKKNWIDTGRLRYVVRDFPLDMHPDAMKAAEATRCAGEQGKYWELRGRLIANAEQLQRPRLSTYAKDVGLDVGKFDACVDSGRYTDPIRADIVEASTQRIGGTPSFIIARTDGMTADGPLVVGALPYGVFVQRFEELSAN